MSAAAALAWPQVAWIVGLMALGCLLAATVARAANKAQKRQEIRERLAALPKPVAASIVGLREQLVAAASAERGEHRVG